MKKTVLTIAIVLGLGLTSFADPNGGGMFQRGTSESEFYGSGWRENDMPALPNHGQTTDQNAPLGTGIAVLTALGAAYLVGKRRKED